MLASVSHDCTVRLWDTRSGAALATFTGHEDYVFDVAFSPDGQMLATASDDDTAKLRDVQSGQVLKTLTGHRAPVSAVAFSPDGKILASVSYDGQIRLWDTDSEVALLTIRGHNLPINTVAFRRIARYWRQDQMTTLSSCGNRGCAPLSPYKEALPTGVYYIF
jgi:WD40 repeat protein